MNISKIGTHHTQLAKDCISKTMIEICKSRSPESYAKMSATKKGKPIPKCCKLIFCIEKNRFYESISIAAKELFISKVLISRVVNGHVKKAKGLTFTRTVDHFPKNQQ
jgi:hypothetical protein